MNGSSPAPHRFVGETATEDLDPDLRTRCCVIRTADGPRCGLSKRERIRRRFHLQAPEREHAQLGLDAKAKAKLPKYIP